MSKSEAKGALDRPQIRCHQLQSHLSNTKVHNLRLMDSSTHVQNFSEDQALRLELLAIDLDQHKDALIEMVNKLHEKDNILALILSENEDLRKEIANLKHKPVTLGSGASASIKTSWTLIGNSAAGVKRKLSNIS